MSNAFAVTDLVAKEALRIAHEKLQFIGTVDTQYDDYYKERPGSGHGASLRVKRPNQYSRRQGSRVMSVQDQDERTQTITVATQDGVDMRFNSQELVQSVSNGAAFNDLSDNYILPAVSVLCSGIESDFIAFCTKATWNTAGTAGTPPTDLVAVGAARAKLNQGLAPKDGNRCIQYDSVNMGTIVNGLKGLFQDSTQIKEQYREGMVGRTAMADWYENDRMWTLTNGSDVTGTTDAAALVTDATLSSANGVTIDMHTTVAVAAQVVGQVFTIAGVNACHPETKAAYNNLQQFTITAIGATTTTIAPQIYLTGPRQNVCKSTGAQLATTDFNSQTLTFIGVASTSYVQNLMYHKEAFQFITADLPLMDDAQKCVRKMQDGLAIRVWMGSDIRNDELLMRLDILYGMAALRPEWASRITM
ncbi:MAG TPA: P22 phage major capsid protein family protein [Nitrospiraceae bacterium]|nr:P22 phage major capsid protein family protein [Nitrospiraceae bacterium]